MKAYVVLSKGDCETLEYFVEWWIAETDIIE